MTFANINSHEIAGALPTQLAHGGAVTFNPTADQLHAAGWRTVVSSEAPPAGFRVTRWTIVDLDGSTCRLAVAATADLAAEAAAAKEAAANTDKWSKELRFILRVIFMIRKAPADMTAAQYKAWLRQLWDAL